ncbi:MAG: branched-chain amino acid ABC transporter substrate-binding protein [Phototrophicaceae bacterium]|jgi:branched-chain amino acid transport system substrate-binding protein
MNRKLLSLILVCVAVWALGVLPIAAQEGEVVKIYTSWPLQGSMQPEGQSMLDAVNLALAHYLEDNEGVGPAGFTIEVVATDDASPTTGSWDGVIEAENAQRCVNDADCMVYFGTYNSGAAKVSMPITNEAGIVQITPANTYPGLTKPVAEGEPEIYRPSGEVNYFRTNAADDLQGSAGAAWAQCLGFERVYILDDRQLYGQGVADAFETRAGEIGLEIVGRSGVESTDIDFRSLLTDVLASGADLVYGGFVIDSGGPQVIQQMDELDLFNSGVAFMGPDGLVSPALVEQVGGPDVVSGNVYLTFPGLTPQQLDSEGGIRFREDFVETYGYEPSAWSTYAYQSMQVILYAVDEAGEKDRTAILETMRGIEEFEGITGTFGFDENGDPTFTTLAGNTIDETGEFVFDTSISSEMNTSCPSS